MLYSSIAEAASLTFCGILNQRENPKQWCMQSGCVCVCVNFNSSPLLLSSTLFLASSLGVYGSLAFLILANTNFLLHFFVLRVRVKMSSTWRSNCCNPLNKPRHSAAKKCLRPVTKKMREQFGLELGSRICDNRRKALYKLMPPIEEEPYTVPSPPSPEFPSSPSSPEYTDFQQSEALEKVSECLLSLGKTPINT